MPERAAPPLQILLAEDHPVARRVATVMLEHLGFSVDVVSDGAEAVRAATATRYEAILMDCQLPTIDGYQATASIRHLEGTGRRTPIIAVTASDDPTEPTRCLGAGMNECLIKPLRLQTLATALTRWSNAGSAVASAGAIELGAPAITTRAADVDVAVLDAEIIERLGSVGRAAGQDLVGQLTVLFLDDAAIYLAAMRAAFARDDAAEMGRSAHTLRGAGANLGATYLAQLCATLITNGKGGYLTDGGALLDDIEVELERVRAALGSLGRGS